MTETIMKLNQPSEPVDKRHNLGNLTDDPLTKKG